MVVTLSLAIGCIQTDSNNRTEYLEKCEQLNKTLCIILIRALKWQTKNSEKEDWRKLQSCQTVLYLLICLMRLCQPPDGSTGPKYKLLCFITTNFFCKEKTALAFNRDRCCHLVLCLRLIPFHYLIIGKVTSYRSLSHILFSKCFITVYTFLWSPL